MVGRSRWMVSTSVTLAALGLTALAVDYVRNTLGDESTLTGWTLLAATASLYLLTLRKKFLRLPLGNVAIWMQVHVYAGTFASIVFLMHIGWPIRGIFESALAFCFVFVAMSGAFLGYLSRATPRKLAALPVDRRLEEIPSLQGSIASDAHSVALRSAGLGEGATLTEFYQRRLLPFFRSPRNAVYRLAPNGVRRRQLLRELNDLDRYLAESGIDSRRQLSSLVKNKDDLDFQQALQSRLRLFFAMHISMTWVLVLMIAVHVVLVYRFQGAIL